MLGLVVGGVVLSNAFRNAAEDSFDARLTVDMDGLIAAAEPDPEGGVMLQDRFVNHQFDRIYSGLYYQIKPLAAGPGGQISRSLFDQVLNVTGNVRRGAVSYGIRHGSREPASARVVAAGGISHQRHARAQRHARLYLHGGGRPGGGGRGKRRLQRHPVLVLPAPGPGPGRGGVSAGAGRPAAACAG